uniref:non-specific serine/threonine protein kinase n=1 Tax=viral metagenome TaxID=1070528 RepID=A0A6C0KSR7_9ZZZZ
MLNSKYNIIEKISEGSFGMVYKAENKRTKDLVAIKIENKNNIYKTLKNEARIYQYLGKLDGFPQLKWFSSNNIYDYLVLDLLGKPLSKIININQKINLTVALTIGIQIIERVKVLHNHDLIHRDLKPDNFLFGLEHQTNKIFLIDFSFCKRYKINGIHIKEKSITKIIGTPNFVSLNVHKGIEPSRRDDIESCIYIIIYIINGNLPWLHCKNNEEILVSKKELIINENIPQIIKIMLDYVYKLKFNEEPNYNYLIKLIKDFILDYNTNKITEI